MVFLLSYSIYSQNWLNCLLDDPHFSYIKEKGKKTLGLASPIFQFKKKTSNVHLGTWSNRTQIIAQTRESNNATQLLEHGASIVRLKWKFSQNSKMLEFFTNSKFEEGGWLVREGFTSQDYMNRAGTCPMTVLGKVPVPDQVLLPYPKGSFVIK